MNVLIDLTHIPLLALNAGDDSVPSKSTTDL